MDAPLSPLNGPRVDADPAIPDPPQPVAAAHAEILAFLQWWRTLDRPAGGLPAWTPELVFGLRPWIGSLFMVRFPDGTLESAYYSLIGIRLVSQFGFDLTGRKVARPNLGAGSFRIANAYRKALESRRPVYSRYCFARPSRLDLVYERLVVPFAAGGGPVDRLLGALYFLNQPPDGWFDETVSVIGQSDSLL